MITRILLYIKHNNKFIWKLIELINGVLFKLLYQKRVNSVIPKIIERYTRSGFEFRAQGSGDLKLLRELILRQSPSDLEFFKPHDFDEKSIIKAFRNPGFIMMGAFSGEIMVGYFFLRCFWNKKCFVGRLVEKNYQGKGLGKVMNEIMYNIAWESGFRCLSTISKNNKAVMNAHAKNGTMVILKELDNDYLLVEFLREGVSRK